MADTPHRPDPLLRSQVAWVRGPLDTAAMHASAQPLLGEHDFIAYCRPRPGATTIRTLRHLDVARRADGIVEVHVAADAFCHNQVRAMVGALLAVGSGQRDGSWPAQVLADARRDGAVHVAPPHGLTLGARHVPARQRARRASRTGAIGATGEAMTDHYFAPADDAGHSPRDVRFRMDGRTWTLASDSHVFSAGRLDPGTEVLLRDAPAPSGEVLLDLGCGYGPIACLLAQRLPGATVWAVDVNERARALTGTTPKPWATTPRSRSQHPTTCRRT